MCNLEHGGEGMMTKQRSESAEWSGPQGQFNCFTPVALHDKTSQQMNDLK